VSSNGIDFVIGGKDQAKPAMASVEQSLSRLEVGTNRLQTATQGLMAAMGPLLAIYAAVKTAMAAIGGIEGSNAAFDEHAKSVSELEVALKLQGVVVDAEMERLEKYADAMQRATGENDSAVLAVMKEAAMLGVAADKLDDMTTAAYGVAEATGKDVSSAMTMMRQATEGNFEAFNKAIPQLRNMTTDEEKFAAVLELSARGMEAKATWASQVEESGAGASTAIDKLMESVGAILAPFRVLISTGIETAANALNDFLSPAVEYATELLENMGPTIEWVKEKIIAGVNGIIAAFTFFEVILTNLDSVWEIAVAQSELWMLQLVGVIEHALTVAIPEYAAWFGENFVNLIRDGLELAFTVVTNHVQKIIDAFKAVWEFIASGGTSDVLGQLGEISGRSWLEGFESSLTDLPSVMGRTISDRETELTETIGRLGGNLGDEFNKKLADRMIKAGTGISDELNKDFELKVKKPDAGKAGASINAMESRLLTRGPGTDPGSIMKRIEDILDKSHSTQKGILKATNTSATLLWESVDELTKITTNTDNAAVMVTVP